MRVARALTWPTASRMSGVARRIERLTKWPKPWPAAAVVRGLASGHEVRKVGRDVSAVVFRAPFWYRSLPVRRALERKVMTLTTRERG